MLAASVLSLYLTLACGIVLSKIYANSMMVVVNDRNIHCEDDDILTDNMITFDTRSHTTVTLPTGNDEA